ncbi:MAG: M24 family metallopeptidase [Planctomycetaceae bacterium]|nr:M24 family metallopeptidase [Planctomycetaceae bacterium]MCA9044999.1 M24 family metallopeptidase [Planctomycetaceae bacterium]MCB9954003.1 M24 family metallopeptidase [Planctomycetaceae bacterium]
MFDLAKIQNAITEFGFDGWLLYDFRGSNPLAGRVLKFPEGSMGSRRCLYFIPKSGEPTKIVHRIEAGALQHLPGRTVIYLPWQELEAAIRDCVAGCQKIAMEFSPGGGNPYVSRVDGGTVDMVRSFGPEVLSSGDLIQLFEATWDQEQWDMHLEAAVHTNSSFDMAWKFIAEQVRENGGVEEVAVRDRIMEHFAANKLTTYHPPIVGRGPHSGMPHYETGDGGDTLIREGDFVLIDQWAKCDRPRSVYSDLTRTGFVGTSVPEEYTKIFNIVAAARDAGIAIVRESFAQGTPLYGKDVDDAVRAVIVEAGYGEYFGHRTGHSIGQEVHGNGANMDNLETREERRVLPGTAFSIEPGIYLPEFGVRSEINVFVDWEGAVQVTGGELQREVVPILAYGS